ncbi:uncharacterized protein [Clytia hemisphaerica]|uniref:Histidine-rich glycoprotein-like n=1 Tax=Clytia hemisphaerica TaxID=252671 RepID=A0A7M5V6A7_9CNID
MKLTGILLSLLLLTVGSFRCKEKRRPHITNNASVKGNVKASDHSKRQIIHGQTHPKKKLFNEEETFLRGFLNDVKELSSSGEQDKNIFELSRTLHSDTFYKALDEKKIKVSYHPTKERETKKRKIKHPAPLLKHPTKVVAAQTKSTSAKPVSKIIASTTSNKQTNSTQYSHKISRKQAIEKELHFLEYLNHKSPEAKDINHNKRENITVHNSVQSSAKLDGVKLGKRFDIATKDFKRENITIHNSVKSTAKLDGVSLGKRQHILKLKVQDPVFSKRENISIHNAVKSSAKLDTVPLYASRSHKRLLKDVSAQNKDDKRQSKSIVDLLPQKAVILLNKHSLQHETPIVDGNFKRENISVHNSVQSSAKLDGVKLGKRGNIKTQTVNVLNQRAKALQILTERENITVHNSGKSTAKLDGVSLGKRQIAKSFTKRENGTVHDPVKITGNMDGLSIGKSKRQKLTKAEKSLSQIKNQIKSRSVSVNQRRDKSPSFSAVSKKTVSEADNTNVSIKKSTTTSNAMPELNSKITSGQKQPNLQAEMEMFNQITETPFDQMELSENMGSVVTQAKMPELKTKKKKGTVVNENTTKKLKNEMKTPTLKSFIGPIGVTSRMVGSMKKTNHNNITQAHPYQRHTITPARVPTVTRSGNRNTSMADSSTISRKSVLVSGQRRKNTVVSSSQEAEQSLNTGSSRSRQKRQIKLQGQNTRQITTDIASQDKNFFSFLNHDSRDEINDRIQQHQKTNGANHQPEYISSFKDNFAAEKNVLPVRSNSTGGFDDEDENEGTHYFDPGTPLPQANSEEEDQPAEGRSTSKPTRHGDGGHGDWWKDYFPHHGTWDDPNHVYGDAQMVHHVPWNAMFPRHSYLPHEDLLNHQQHSYMGNQFHHSYERHNPKQNPGFLGASPASAEVNFYDGSLVEGAPRKTHRHGHPYGHNTPYLAGDGMESDHEGANEDEGDGREDVVESVHGDLCVEKRDGICSYSGTRRTQENNHDVEHHEHHDHTHEHVDHHHDHAHHHHHHHDDHETDHHDDEGDGDVEYHDDGEGEQSYYGDHGNGGGYGGHHDGCHDHHDDCHHEDVHHHHDHHHHHHEHVHHDHEHHHHHHHHDHHDHHHDHHHHDDHGHYGGYGVHHRSTTESMVEFQRNPLDPHSVDISDHHDHDEHHHEALISPIPQAVEQIAVDPSNHVHYLSRDDLHDLHYDNGLLQHHDIERFHDDDHHHDDHETEHHYHDDDHEDHHGDEHHYHDDHHDDHHGDEHHNSHHEDHHDDHHDQGD